MKRITAMVLCVLMIFSLVPQGITIPMRAEAATQSEPENKTALNKSGYEALGFTNLGLSEPGEDIFGPGGNTVMFEQKELLFNYNGSSNYGKVLRDNVMTGHILTVAMVILPADLAEATHLLKKIQIMFIRILRIPPLWSLITEAVKKITLQDLKCIPTKNAQNKVLLLRYIHMKSTPRPDRAAGMFPMLTKQQKALPVPVGGVITNLIL